MAPFRSVKAASPEQWLPFAHVLLAVSHTAPVSQSSFVVQLFLHPTPSHANPPQDIGSSCSQ
jgi:hypothetical protein